MSNLKNLLKLDSDLINENSQVILNVNNGAKGVIVNITDKKVRIIRRPLFNPKDSKTVYLEIYRIISFKDGKTYLDLEDTKTVSRAYEYYSIYNSLLADNRL